MFYKLGRAAAWEKLGYGALKNILGAGKEGLGFLTPEAKAVLTGMGAGGAAGGITGAVADTPGGAAGGALAGMALGGGAGRMGEALSRRFGKAHEAARAFGSTASTAPPTREALLEQLMKSGSLLDSALVRGLGGGALGAGVGAGIGSATDLGAGKGALIGAGGGATGGLLGRHLLKALERGKSIEATERGVAGAGEAAGGAARGATEETAGATPMRDYLRSLHKRISQTGKNLKNVATGQPKELGPSEWLNSNFKNPHYNAVFNRRAELTQNPEAWKKFLEERGLTATPASSGRIIAV